MAAHRHIQQSELLLLLLLLSIDEKYISLFSFVLKTIEIIKTTLWKQSEYENVHMQAQSPIQFWAQWKYVIYMAMDGID